MEASIVPQDGAQKTRSGPEFAAGGKVELYEIKWDKLRNAVQRRIAEKVPKHPVWGRQAAVYGSGVKFNRC